MYLPARNIEGISRIISHEARLDLRMIAKISSRIVRINTGRYNIPKMVIGQNFAGLMIPAA